MSEDAVTGGGDDAPSSANGGEGEPSQKKKAESTDILKVPFHALCSMFDRIVSTSNLKQKQKYLSKFLSKIPRCEELFEIFRLILPQLDRERPNYSMKEAILGKFYIQTLNIPEESKDGRRLTHWRRPTAGEELAAGDFGNAVFLSLRNRCPEKGNLTTHAINAHLDALSQTADRKEKGRVLKALLRQTSAEEQKWLVRIILKELKMGMSERTVLGAYHPNALEMLQVTSNLRKVITDLVDLSKRVENSDVHVGRPIRPMLASRKSPDEVPQAMNASEDRKFAIETKFDGERVQIHVDAAKGEVRMFSRNSLEITTTYRPFIDTIKEHVSTTCILDGELLVYDNINETFEQFGKLKTFAKFLRDQESGVELVDRDENMGKQLCYMCFDVLFVRDRQVMDLNLAQRRILLARIIRRPTPKVFEITQQMLAHTKEELTKALDDAIFACEEGLIVKNLDAVYTPNERKDKWIKLKPIYVEGAAEDLDVLIVGGYWGKGVTRRGGTISHFMLGVKAPTSDSVKPEEGDSSNEPLSFYSFAKVGSGYSDTELRELQRRLEKHWRVYNKDKPPSCLQLAPPFKEKPDMWIDPRKSVMLQVKAEGLVVTDKFKTGYTLRFPRVQRIRFDKPWDTGLDHAGVLELARRTDGRLAKRTYDEALGRGKAKKRRTAVRRQERTVRPDQLGPDLAGLEVIDGIFSGCEVCVMNGGAEFAKKDMEALVHQHGGTTIQNVKSTTTHVVASRNLVKVQALIRANTHDVIRPRWLMDCVSQKELLLLEPKYLIHTTEATRLRFRQGLDQFGDSYNKDSTAETLKDVFKEIDGWKAQHPEDRDVVMYGTASALWLLDCLQVDRADDTVGAQLMEKHMNKLWWNMFKNYRVYVDQFSVLCDSSTRIPFSPLQTTDLILRFYGATITHTIDAQTTHVVMHADDTSRLRDIRRIRKGLVKQPPYPNLYVVSHTWVSECTAQHEDLDERNFAVRSTLQRQ